MGLVSVSYSNPQTFDLACPFLRASIRSPKIRNHVEVDSNIAIQNKMLCKVSTSN